MAGVFKTNVFPDDPRALPPPARRIEARSRLRDLLPAGSYLEANTYEHLRFISHVRYWSDRPRPRCPGCRRRLDEQFLLLHCGRPVPLDDPLRRTAPCCGAEVALDTDLRWPWDTGYARFVLQAMHQQRAPKARLIRTVMAEALGRRVRVYQEMPSGSGHLPMKG